MSGFRCQKTGVRKQMSEVRGQRTLGLRNLGIQGYGSAIYGLRNLGIQELKDFKILDL